MSKNILITGANGQLGSDIKFITTESEDNFFFTNIDNLDICNILDIEAFVKENKIDTIVNCAAYTAVDKAESDKDNAFLVNQMAVRFLAEVAAQYNCYLIHISTDFIFDGKTTSFYTEIDTPNPLNVYGASKLKGEEEIYRIAYKNLGDFSKDDPEYNINSKLNCAIIRTSWVYSCFGNNFVKTIQKLALAQDKIGIVSDQIGTPTYARDLAKVILKFIEKDPAKGVDVFNFSNEGVASWYDFAKAIVELSHINCHIQPIATENYPTPATRPMFSVLDKTKIKDHLGISIPHWRESLNEFVRDHFIQSISI